MNASQICRMRGGSWNVYNQSCQIVSQNPAYYGGYYPQAQYADKSQAAARACVSRGGLWDSFTGECAGRSGQVFNPYPLYTNYGYPVQMKYFNPMSSPYAPVAPQVQNIPEDIDIPTQEDVFALF